MQDKAGDDMVRESSRIFGEAMQMVPASPGGLNEAGKAMYLAMKARLDELEQRVNAGPIDSTEYYTLAHALRCEMEAHYEYIAALVKQGAHRA